MNKHGHNSLDLILSSTHSKLILVRFEPIFSFKKLENTWLTNVNITQGHESTNKKLDYK